MLKMHLPLNQNYETGFFKVKLTAPKEVNVMELIGLQDTSVIYPSFFMRIQNLVLIT